MDLAKLKVADLKAELAARNLDTKGVKAVLLERLKEALERESSSSANANVDMTSQYLMQQQHQEKLLMIQRQQKEQQQLLFQQQHMKQQLLQQQRDETELLQMAAEMHAEEQQFIEDLSMPSNRRVDTPVRRRSVRRSMTRSPSPTNSSADNPHASLMGSARKRGRSRSMTKSPSPQRLMSEAPCLASVQEEEPDPVVAGTEQRLVTEEPTPQPTVVPCDELPSVPDDTPSEQKAPSEASTEPVSAMEVEEYKESLEPVLTAKQEVKVEEEVKPPPAVETVDETALVEASVPASKQEEEPTEGDDTKAKPDESANNPVAANESDEKAPAKAAEDAPSETAKTDGAKTNDKKDSSQNQAQNSMIEFVSEEVEPQLPEEAANTFTLSWYDSNLNMVIDDKDLLSAKTLSDGIFGLVWAGARASRGVLGGKVFYEVLVTDNLLPATKSRFVPDGETPTLEMRLGWSTAVEGKLQLGETEHSYGYSSCGKKVTGGNFEQYGVAYGKNDVVGVYLDMESSPCRMQFTVNRVRQGEAFEFEKDSLDGKALFPHVYAKNLAFKVNFGTVSEGFPLSAEEKKAPSNTEQSAATETPKEEAKENDGDNTATEAKAMEEDGKEEIKPDTDKDADTKKDEEEKKDEPAVATDEAVPPAEPVVVESVPFDEDFKFLNRFTEENEELVAEGLKGPSARDCCELIMTIGLPGCGKTNWLQQYLKDNPDSTFTLLSIESLLENMKVLGKAREPSNTPEWQKIIEQLSRNMARLIEVACKRRRHFIIDQTNVFASEQKRRLKRFGGFKTRRAVAIVPSMEEYKRRYDLKVAQYGKEVPETSLNTMKANMFVPSLEQNWYTELVFPELAEAEAQEVIKKFNEEGRKLLPPRRNRANQSNRQKHNNANANSNYTSRWNHNNRQQGGGQQYGKNRYGGGGGGGGQGGGYGNRYGNKSTDVQYGHHRAGDYRSGNGYGRRDDHHRGGNYGSGGNRYDSWTRNSGGGGGGYYNDRGYSNRGYHQQQQDHSNNRYDGRRRDRRGYNNGSGWNSQGGQSQQWNSYPKSGNSDSWYLWWQSNLNNLLAPNGSNDDASGSSSAQWNQYGGGAQHSSSSYGGYNSKGSGGGGGGSTSMS
ncbi:heterogeneous nuclear ribonucleoprotein U-like protein 2 [Anopheles nili]|uniref:heterogeneous nuclear ribonucleoprotein U-like protein 2 n=1 Tax=Anopheles nili TaxID=185578 RepID=UPI00237B6CF1|nr:heterogeneous nuclear ribonucleoprotein U-like protein 2 [Anopheles nili]